MKKVKIEIPKSFRILEIIKNVVNQITDFLQYIQNEIEDIFLTIDTLKKDIETIKKKVGKK